MDRLLWVNPVENALWDCYLFFWSGFPGSYSWLLPGQGHCRQAFCGIECSHAFLGPF